MSSNNGGGEVIVVLILMAVAYYVFIFLLVVAFYIALAFGAAIAFVAFAWTIVCLVAWNRPFHLGKIYVDCGDARAFVLRGVFGGIAVPVFLGLADVFTGLTINWHHIAYYIAGGYVLLSVGFEYLFATGADVPYVYHDYQPPQFHQLPAPPQTILLPPKSTPPRFASWNDEEELP